MERIEQEETAEYKAFVDKFKPKKTTDDCYTPALIYEAVKDWACKEYNIASDKIVRPFYPGGDYENYEYPEGCVVLDNPPFSILSKIIAFYLERGIAFFLFAPTLTAFSGRNVAMQPYHHRSNSNLRKRCKCEHELCDKLRRGFSCTNSSGIKAGNRRSR